MVKGLRLKKELIFPKGTVFKNIDGMKSEFTSGNYEHLFGLGPDTYGRLIYSLDEAPEIEEYFEEVE